MRRLWFKNISRQMLLRLAAVLTFAAGLAAVSLSVKKETTTPPVEEPSGQVFPVEISSLIDKNSSDEEILRHWMDYGVLPVSSSEIYKRNVPLPNVCGYLYAHLKADGKITLNSEKQQDLSALGQRIKTVFQERARNGVFEENSSRVISKVIVRAETSAKYEDVLKVIEVIKDGGAEPIVLMIDELPPTGVSASSD